MILDGIRNTRDGLWDIVVPSNNNKTMTEEIPNYKINVILKKDTVKKDLSEFLHAACFSPTKSTFIKAIQNGNLDSWSGLTVDLIKKTFRTFGGNRKSKYEIRAKRFTIYQTNNIRQFT